MARCAAPLQRCNAPAGPRKRAQVKLRNGRCIDWLRRRARAGHLLAAVPGGVVARWVASARARGPHVNTLVSAQGARADATASERAAEAFASHAGDVPCAQARPQRSFAFPPSTPSSRGTWLARSRLEPPRRARGDADGARRKSARKRVQIGRSSNAGGADSRGCRAPRPLRNLRRPHLRACVLASSRHKVRLRACGRGCAFGGSARDCHGAPHRRPTERRSGRYGSRAMPPTATSRVQRRRARRAHLPCKVCLKAAPGRPCAFRAARASAGRSA